MKKFLLTLAVAVCTAFSSLAATIVVDFATGFSGIPTSSSTTVAKATNQDVAFTFYKAYKSSSAKYLMVTKGGYVTFQAPDGQVLTDFTIHTSSGASTSVNVQLSVGGTNIGNAVTLNMQNADFSWSIPAANQGKGVTYKLAASNKNAQITKITFTVVDSGVTPGLSVAAPTFTPATGTKLYADDKVTIACETEDAEITYTVNGGESQAYPAEGISFSEDGTYTIKATATLTKDGETATANAEATYTYAVEAPQEIHAVRVTSTDNILEGAEYVLALNDKAMGNTLGGTSSKPYIPTTAATYADDALIVDREKHAIINFEPAESGKWYLKVSNFGETGGYVKSAISAGNNCTIGTDPEHAAEVTFTTVSGEVRAQIHYVTDGTDSYLAANNSANRYSCYTSYDDNGSKARPALYALPAEDMAFSAVGPDGAEVSSTIDIENYKNAATGNYYNITVSYPKGTALYYRTTSYHMMVNGVDVLKPIVVDDKEIIPVLGEFKLAPKAEAAAAAASVAAESGMNTTVIGLASKGDFELRLQDAAGNVSEGKSYKINGNATGVEDIAVDGVEDGEAVYYNMQGVRVANPAAGSLYIRVQGSKAAKVLVK